MNSRASHSCSMMEEILSKGCAIPMLIMVFISWSRLVPSMFSITSTLTSSSCRLMIFPESM